MQTFLSAFRDRSDIEELKSKLLNKKGLYEITGCIDNAKSHLIHSIGYEAPMRLVVTESEQRSRELLEEYRFFDPGAVYFPAKDLLFYQSNIHGNAIERERIAALCAICDKSAKTIFTTVDALLNRLPDPDSFTSHIIYISEGDEIDSEELRKKLIALGYESRATVDAPGLFAIRGGIIDIWSQDADSPFRIELWDTEVDSIRIFDGATQKSVDNVKNVRVVPARELWLSDDIIETGLRRMRDDMDNLYEKYRKDMKTEAAYRLKSSYEELAESIREGWGISEAENHLPYFCEEVCGLLDYLEKGTFVYLDEPGHLSSAAHLIEEEFKESMIHRGELGEVFPEDTHMMLPADATILRAASGACICLSMLDIKNGIKKAEGQLHMEVSSVISCNNHFEELLRELKSYHTKKYRVVVISPSRTRAKRLADDILNEGINAFYSENYDEELFPGQILVTRGSIRRGFEYRDCRFAVICESDIFGGIKKEKRKKRHKEADHIASLDDLTVGDYVIHENYGLGIYQGMEKMEVDHVMKDYIKISYAGSSNLYVLATQTDMLSKYGQQGDKKPKLSTLGTKEWSKTKEKVKSSVGVVAHELVELYARRQQQDGYVYGPDTVWQKEFEETFPYDETEGQIEAIEDVKRDMMSTKIMDRLICGDVGFGKTEIAIRAAFKAVQENKQVAYLVPTTILAQQHYNTFTQRMSEYPVKIEILSRFKTAAENRATIKRLATGEADIVIGTHRLLSKDVSFKDLGLLIIDEEQRFGVTHKERIKQMKQTVDVLSLSATPIPRTLHMSLVGIRDMSLLEEAPLERMPIQTFVFERNDELVREAIRREIGRGGQVYYVVNRIRDIADITARLQELIPDVHIAYAHGRMDENRLEEIMKDFIERDIDVLVATTIIEIGLDISNVNTLIIHDADQLGLAQLYQLRGRVGRSSRTAYAFLMYRRDKMLKEVAEKRLAAIREYTDLGSGYKIAMRDLEIRGAGNLLGEEQHGHIAAVGYDLYCKLLNEAVRTEKGEGTETSFTTSADLMMDAYIPDNYIRDSEVKLDIYKRIASVESEEEQSEIVDELIDRFGEPPLPVLNLLYIASLRSEAHKLYIRELKQDDNKLSMILDPEARLNPAGIPALVEKYSPCLQFVADKEKPAFYFYYKKNSKIASREPTELWKELMESMRECLL